MGSKDLKEMDEGIMDPEGRGLTQAGKICGMVSVSIQVLGLLIWIAAMVIGVTAGVANAS